MNLTRTVMRIGVSCALVAFSAVGLLIRHMA